MVPYKCCCFSAKSAQGRIQGGAKIGHRGPLQETSSSDRKATATNRMHSNDLESMWEDMLLCLMPFRSQIFDVFLDLNILPYFYVISIDFYVV